MKNIISKLTVIISVLLLATACDEDSYYYYDNDPPSPPTNIISITGDNRVDLAWDHSRESDVAGYNVYFSFDFNGTYELIGHTEDNYFIDFGAQNGETYYYAVTSYDFNSNESELSYDVVYDTPRPEGFNQAIFDFRRYPNTSGYSFDDYIVVSFDDIETDFFFENYDGVFYLNVWDDTDIQDVGSTQDIYDVTVAPVSGYVPLIEGDNVKYVEAIPGHTYVVWTWDNHFAKIRIARITSERVVFDWAYQLIEGEIELKRSVKNENRPFDSKSVNINSR
ncbi:MAG: hypothetical protein K9J12_15620 [Melioribacteraceae bacterium]|nr:hypothetical protein [Melioribacteraceae bacterium]MCF8264862.1 hypothetical protein [Melioribacteraceae bacterium]MCF8413677.1 hypothetical protein [Melioribacteraceae bacterium]MCF8432150.1 hypothetical protein [Melioribacteraceae bacterium]